MTAEILSYQQLILNHLLETDDPNFWLAAVTTLFSNVESELAEAQIKYPVYVQLGACSHWLRPHQTRWTASGGFAWPSGYGGGQYSRSSLPEFDWSVILRWDTERLSWTPTEKFTGKRRCLFRAALPTRTRKHQQAAIHTLWSPGKPSKPREKITCFYGFRKVDGDWLCVATS